MAILVVLLIAFVGLIERANAGTTGKIAGRVVDAETGEPLPGVNVVMVGTEMGAAADSEGDYFIINIPLGIYAVEASMVGYIAQTKTGIRIHIDRTTTVNFELESTPIEMAGITVVGEREIIPADVSASQRIIAAEEVTEAPVLRTEEVIGLQPGVRLQDDSDAIGFVIRGGDVSEVGFTMDGVSLVDDRVQVPYIGLSRSSIQEIQVLTGGFNAEYGNIRSGLINIVTKEGSDRFHGSVDYGYQLPRKRHFGPGAFDPESNLYQTFAYGEYVFEGWSKETSPIGRYFMGWNEFSRRTLVDDNLDNDMTPQEALELWKWRHRGYDYGDKPDHTLDFSLSGPLFGKLRFFTSLWWEKSWLLFPLARDDYQNMTGQIKLTYPLSSQTKLSLRYLGGQEEAVKGGWLSNGLIRSLEAADDQAWNLFNEGETALADNIRHFFNFKLTQMLSSNTYYDLYVDYSRFQDYAWPMRQRSYDLIEQIGDREYDETPAAWEKHPEVPSDQPGMFAMSVGTATRDSSWYEGFNVKFDLTSQVNKYNQIKTGFIIDTDSYHEYRASVSPAFYLYDSPQRIKYDKTSITGAVYIQDKLEFEGMIANLGLRLDLFDPRTDWIDFDDPFNEELAASNYDPAKGAPEHIPAELEWKLAPRLGISHPVTAASKVYFNYGHFYQVQPPHILYRAYSNNARTFMTYGNPHLTFPRTVAYEVGFEQNIADLLLLHIAGYYKNVTDELRSMTVHDYDESVLYTTYKNDGYADYRGIEVWLQKQHGRFFTGWLNIDYMVLSSGSIGRSNIYENPNLQQYERRFPTQSKPYARPRYNLLLDLHTPPDWGPLFGNVFLIFIHEWESGGRWTWNPENKPGVINDIRNTDHANTNLRFVKRFSVGTLQPSFYIEVRNLFNRKELNTNHFWDSSEFLAYMYSLRDGDRYGDYPRDGEKEYIQLGWMDFRHFLNPRVIKMGLKFIF